MNNPPTSKHLHDMPQPTHRERDRDLDWDAFRYVAGEMTPAEVQTFESRLEDDQRAREAVSAAVELGSVLSVQDDIPVTTRRRSPQSLGWIGIGVSACLAIAWLAYPPADSTQPVTPVTDAVTAQSQPDAAKLAMLWSETREELIHSEGNDEFWGGPAEDSAAADSPLDGLGLASDVVTPDWMLVGIKSLEEAGNSLTDDMDTTADEGKES